MISLHNIAHIRATQSTMPGGNWAELHFTSGVGEQSTLTLYFDNPLHAQAFADKINELFVSLDVLDNLNLDPKEPVE